MFSSEISQLAEKTIIALLPHEKTIATAESCTGGLIVGALTAVPGSSKAVYGGYITYANEAKSQMVGVPGMMIAEFGAVSEHVARAMAEGALMASGADISIAVTGIAGPTGGSKEKPVGLVHFACATNVGTYHLKMLFEDGLSREAIRDASVISALEMVLEILEAGA